MSVLNAQPESAWCPARADDCGRGRVSLAGPVEQQPTRYAYIDALRGFAALWVLLYHLWNRFYPGLSTQGHPLSDGVPTDTAASLSLFTFGLGYFGVTLFFVLSGFCIHLPQARRGHYLVELKVFASRRFWRLYPAYFASILFSVIVLATPKLLLALDGRSFDWLTEVRASDALVSAAFLQPFWPESFGLNGVYWTLVYEVQFYMAYPVLLWSIRKTGLLPVGITLLAAEVYFAFAPAPLKCFFLARYFEWFLGVLAAEMLVRHPGRIPPAAAACCACVAIATAVCSLFEPAVYPLRDVLLALGFCALLLFLARSRLATATHWRLLAAVGIFSYSLYLIHVPIIDFVWVGLQWLVAEKLQNVLLARWLSLLAVPISLAAAVLFFRLFERPFLRTRRHQHASAPTEHPHGKLAA